MPGRRSSPLDDEQPDPSLLLDVPLPPPPPPPSPVSDVRQPSPLPVPPLQRPIDQLAGVELSNAIEVPYDAELGFEREEIAPLLAMAAELQKFRETQHRSEWDFPWFGNFERGVLLKLDFFYEHLTGTLVTQTKPQWLADFAAYVESASPTASQTTPYADIPHDLWALIWDRLTQVFAKTKFIVERTNTTKGDPDNPTMSSTHTVYFRNLKQTAFWLAKLDQALIEGHLRAWDMGSVEVVRRMLEKPQNVIDLRLPAVTY